VKTVSVKLKINAKEIEFWYRPDSVGDKGVIKQVFQQRDYELVHWQQRHALYAFRDAQILNGRRPLIVDAGANIGAAATYFSCTFQRPLLIIELHDWMLPFAGSSRGFLRAIASLDFDVVHRGENIFCFNRRLLLSYAHGISTE
jgi:hypothetical protein